MIVFSLIFSSIAMVFHVLTLFPEMFKAFKKESIIGRALKAKKVKINLVQIRDFASGKHKKVDDTPYGGGEGMVMMCEPLFFAIESVLQPLRRDPSCHPDPAPRPARRGCGAAGEGSCTRFARIIYLSPRGKKLTQRTAERLLKYSHLILLCGRYEGVDQRVIDTLVDEEISIGDYVLTGGELPAQVLMDSVIRLIPGVLGKEASHEQDSFSKAFGGKKEYPHYTKPAEFRGLKVPETLLSGNHPEIEKWRRKHLQ